MAVPSTRNECHVSGSEAGRAVGVAGDFAFFPFHSHRNSSGRSATLTYADLKDLGFPPHLILRTGLSDPNPIEKVVLPLAGVLLVGLATVYAAKWASLTGVPAILAPAEISGSIFIGAVAAGLGGFAFSAITGSLLLHVLTPTAAVPLMLSCSITIQIFSIAALWGSMRWKECIPLLLGGVFGIPVGAFLLRTLSPSGFDDVFGAFLVAYSLYMLLRPSFAIRQDGGGRLAAIAIGFGGGITGGAVAFPGAFPTMWCALRGLPKGIQRGTVQPFILIMQVATLVYFSNLGLLGATTGSLSLWCIPVALCGTWLGIRLFHRINDAMFRRVLLVFLLFSGAALAL